MNKTRNLQAENDKLRDQLNFAIGQLQSIKANALNDPYVGRSRESAMRALALQASQAVKMIELGIIRRRSTVIRDASEALLRVIYGVPMHPGVESAWPEAKVLREALGLTIEQLRVRDE